MNKYKHKATGKIFIKTDFCNPDVPNESYYKLDSEDRQYYIEKEFIENSNDWEEVKSEYIGGTLVEVKKEPNYLITAFNNIVTGDTIKHDTQLKDMYCYIDGKSPFYDKADLLKNNQWIVSKVKNNKGEEFCVGDDIKGDGEYFKIASFEFADYIYGGCYVCGKVNGNTHKLALKLATKIKTPIYTTTDGVDIKEGSCLVLYLINKELNNPLQNVAVINSFSKEDAEVANRYLTFTSEENRDKYIKENGKKVIFVSADGKVFYDNDTDYTLFSVLPKANWQENRYRLLDCIKFPKKEWLHFHTKEARQEYIDNNKPRFSLADIEKCYPSPTGYENRIKDIPLVATLFSNLKRLGK